MVTARRGTLTLAVLLIASGLTGCGPHWVSAAKGSTATSTPSPSASSAAPSVRPTSTLKPKPTEAPKPSPKPVPRPTPHARPSRKPIVVAKPPVAHRAEHATRCGSIGTDVAKAVVRQALLDASSREYWTKTTGIVAPIHLMKAIAWQESGWQSSIVACDGGIGTMQVMPATAAWLNDRFGSDFDVKTVSGNTFLGAEYIAWLIKYFGDVYYASATNPYSLENPGMLDAVISAYNVGADAVDPTKGVPNPNYVRSVRALMTSCPCSAY
jgi:hypothetical protein